MNRIKKAFSRGASEVSGGFGQIFSKFKIKSGYKHSRDFFASNTLVAYIVFILLMVLLLLVIINIGVRTMSYVTAPADDPSFYIHGNCTDQQCSTQRYQPDATIGNTWLQDPNDRGCPDGCLHKTCFQPIIRSSGGRYGIEFTWSIWIYVGGIGSADGGRQHIFSKGSDTVLDGESTAGTSTKNGMLTPNNAPGLYLHPSKNALYVVMNTFDMIDEEVEVNDIPLNKWINVIIRCEGKTLDVYVNGTIAIRHRLSSVPKQNYGNVHATKNGGFKGQWSLLQYYDHSLNTTEIMAIVSKGPDLRSCSNAPIVPPYLAMQWYFDNPID